ncbi:alkaline phosphatase family protein [Actinomyces urinae]|uniref:alkaline phosphatase family protein n=1 Tax=Actinomyces urinae TaxID=1689268 RepID=UPI000930FF8D|nr:nucleotide pyrophosphatase/phosphodiesterase family protein [Actinomyces urinae]
MSLDKALSMRASHPSICDILPVVFGAWGVSGPPPQSQEQRDRLADYLQLERGQQTLVVLIDGFGFDLVVNHFAYTPFLRSRKADMMRACTVLPSTTAAAISSFATGLMPGQTNMVGWSVKDGSQVATLLTFENASVPPEKWQSNPTMFEIASRAGVSSAAIMPQRFAGSGLTMAALRGARPVGAESFDERIDAAMKRLRAGAAVVYLYWSDLDHAGHGYGTHCDQWVGELELVDAALARINRELPKGVRALVTGDHGMVNTRADRRIDVAQNSKLLQDLELIAGEGRAVHIHAATNPNKVIGRWRDELGERATIVEGGEVVEILGGESGAKLTGNAVAFMHDDWVVVDSRTQPKQSIDLVGVHGSFSSAELAIPILRFD